jgi:hypothetical protein
MVVWGMMAGNDCRWRTHAIASGHGGARAHALPHARTAGGSTLLPHMHTSRACTLAGEASMLGSATDQLSLKLAGSEVKAQSLAEQLAVALDRADRAESANSELEIVGSPLFVLLS